MQSPSHAPDTKHVLQLNAVAGPAQGICYSSLDSRVWNVSEPAGKTQPQTFTQICLLSWVGNFNRCLQRAAALAKTLCQNANKKPYSLPFLLAKCLHQSSTGVKNTGGFSDAHSRRRISPPSTRPRQNCPSPFLSARLPKGRHTTQGRHRCRQQGLPCLSHVTAQQFEVRQEFKRLPIRSRGHQTRIWELRVLPQKWPFNPTAIPLPTCEGAIEPL